MEILNSRREDLFAWKANVYCIQNKSKRGDATHWELLNKQTCTNKTEIFFDHLVTKPKGETKSDKNSILETTQILKDYKKGGKKLCNLIEKGNWNGALELTTRNVLRERWCQDHRELEKPCHDFDKAKLQCTPWRASCYQQN